MEAGFNARVVQKIVERGQPAQMKPSWVRHPFARFRSDMAELAASNAARNAERSRTRAEKAKAQRAKALQAIAIRNADKMVREAERAMAGKEWRASVFSGEITTQFHMGLVARAEFKFSAASRAYSSEWRLGKALAAAEKSRECLKMRLDAPAVLVYPDEVNLITYQDQRQNPRPYFGEVEQRGEVEAFVSREQLLARLGETDGRIAKLKERIREQELLKN